MPSGLQKYLFTKVTATFFETRSLPTLRRYYLAQRPPTNSCRRARHEWPFRLRFARNPLAQLDLAPTLEAFASRSAISTPPRFARDYSARATLVIFVETHRLRTSDAERDQGVSRKPSLHAIRESRIASSPRDKMIDSFAPAHFGLSACPSMSLDSHRLG